jgi:hypothetical protein
MKSEKRRVLQEKSNPKRWLSGLLWFQLAVNTTNLFSPAVLSPSPWGKSNLWLAILRALGLTLA